VIDLDRATRALRDEHDGASVGAQQTRASIMRSLHEGTHRRRVRWGFGIPLAVIFAGSTAFAGARGDLGETIAEAFSSVRELVTGTPAEKPRAPSHGPRSTAAPRVSPDVSSGAVPPPPPPEQPEALVPQQGPPSALPAQTPRGAGGPVALEHRAAPSTPVPTLPPPDEDAASAPPTAPTESNEATRLYRKAHDAQFVQGDCERALSAYDEYLASAPSDRLVPEARYNRAVCLVRLGRTDAALSALRPFAEGAYGEYRRREARELLDALGSK
jgi:hypothetical protein